MTTDGAGPVPSGADPELGRLVQVRRPGHSRGTGYLIADGLVLTAAHVVQAPGADTAVMVRLFDPAAGPDDGWVPAEVVPGGPASDAPDVALLRVDAGALPDTGTPAPRWGRIGGTAPVPVFAVCFPRVMKDGRTADTHVVRGIVEPAQGAGAFAAGRAMLALTNGSIVPARLPSGRSPWAGASGAAVFASGSGQLVGVLTDDFDLAADASVLSFTLVAAVDGLAELAGAEPAPIEAAPAGPGSQREPATAGAGEARVFVSYGRADPGDFLELIRSFLAGERFEIWLDVRTMPNRGRTFLDEIRRAIEDADRFVLVLGPGALASRYVEAEWRHALLVGKPVHVVIRDLSPEEVPEPLRSLDLRHFTADNTAVQLDRLAAQLREPPAPVGPFLTPVGPLPVRHVPRPDVEAPVRSFLRAPADEVGPGPGQVLVLAGMPGVGKTSTVTACVSDFATRRLFSDGIAVVNCSDLEDPTAIEARVLATIGPQLGGDAGGSGRRDLRAVLDGRRVLIVLENVEDASALGEIGWLSPGVRVIVNSRNPRVGTRLGYPQLIVSCPGESTGVAILEGWAGRSVRSGADLAERLGHHPLALRIAGSMIASGLTEEAVTERQAHPGALAVDPALGLDFGALMAAAAGSLDADGREVLALLGLFTVDEDVPLHILRRAAGPPGPGGAHDLALGQLLDRGLIDVDWSAERLRAHRLVHTWCRDLLDRERGTADAHRAFVRTYAEDVGRLGEVPDDGYLFDHLVLHLVQGGLVDAAIALVTSESWADRRLTANDYDSRAVLGDLSRVCEVCVDELRRSPGAEETAHRSRSLGVLAWRICQVVGHVEPRGVALVRALVGSGLWNTARALHHGQQAVDDLEACHAVSALLGGGSPLDDREARSARSILLGRLARAARAEDFEGRFLPCLLVAGKHLEGSDVDALLDIVRSAGTPFDASLAAVRLLAWFPGDERIRALVMGGVADQRIEPNERATLIASAADRLEDEASLDLLHAAADGLDEHSRPWAVIGLALAHPEYWRSEDRAGLQRAAKDRYLTALCLAFGHKVDRELAEFVLASEDGGIAVDVLTVEALYPHLGAAGQDAWRTGLVGRAREGIADGMRFGVFAWQIERYAEVLARYVAMAPPPDTGHLAELLSLVDLLPPDTSSASLLLALLEHCDDEAARSAVGQRLDRMLAGLDEATRVEVRCLAFGAGLLEVSGPEQELLAQVLTVADPSARSRCVGLVSPHVSRGGLRGLAVRGVRPAERAWIDLLAGADPGVVTAELRDWNGADDGDEAWPRSLRLVLETDRLATEDRTWAEVALLRACAEPELKERPTELEWSVVARAFNEYRWVLNFSEAFRVLRPEAVSIALAFLEENVPDSPNSGDEGSPEWSAPGFREVIRWLYVATRLERRRATGGLTVPAAYGPAPALRHAARTLAARAGGDGQRRAPGLRAAAAVVVEEVLAWCDRWHGYGRSPAFLGDVSRRPVDRYYALAVLVELLPQVSAVTRRRILQCIEAEIDWIPPGVALALIGTLTETAEPDELDRVTAVMGLGREDPHWIRAVLYAHADTSSAARHCDLGTAALRYVVGLAHHGPGACLLGTAELSARAEDLTPHLPFDLASLLAGLLDAAGGPTGGTGPGAAG